MICLTGTDDLPHGYCISSPVLRVCLTGADDLSHGYCRYASRELMIFLIGTAVMHHRYCAYASDLPHGTECPHRYCWHASQLLMIFLTGTEDSLYRVIFLNTIRKLVVFIFAVQLHLRWTVSQPIKSPVSILPLFPL